MVAIPYLTEYPSLLLPEENGRVAYFRGHSREDGGAESPRTGLSEWEYYGPVLPEVAKHLQIMGVHAEVWQRDKRSEWFAMKDLVNERHVVKPYDLVTMCHLNACNTRARGIEVLCWHKSKLGYIAAECLLEELVKLFGGPNRGVKKLAPGIRAEFMTRLLDPVAIIAEAGFIDNETDEKALVEMKDFFDEAIVRGTIAFLEYKGIKMED